MTLKQAVDQALYKALDLAVMETERASLRMWRDLMSQGISSEEAAQSVAAFREQSDETILAALPQMEIELYRQLSA